jgi:hypothetical protein
MSIEGGQLREELGVSGMLLQPVAAAAAATIAAGAAAASTAAAAAGVAAARATNRAPRTEQNRTIMHCCSKNRHRDIIVLAPLRL